MVVSSCPQGASLKALDASLMAKNSRPTKNRKYLRTLIVTVSFRTGRPQVVEVKFLTAAVHDKSVTGNTFELASYLLSDSMTVQLARTQEVTMLLNPRSRQRHVSLVGGHSDCGKEAARHSSYTALGQHCILPVEFSCLTLLTPQPGKPA